MGRTRIAVLGDHYVELTEAIDSAGYELAEVPMEAEVAAVSFGGDPKKLAELVQTSTALRWVQLPSAGIEAFRESLEVAPDLCWTSAKGAYAEPVAEHALALTLALLRELPRRVRARTWEAASGVSLHGLNVVVVGSGGVALEIVRLMKCFRTSVTVVRRKDEIASGADLTVTQDRLHDVLPNADVLVLAAALTDETRGMIGRKELQMLRSNAVLVNIGRGGLIDTDVLVACLAKAGIMGAALDVTDPEPLPEKHPLWSEPRALVTPHAADTLEMIRPLYAARLRKNLERFERGDALVGVVDPIAGY